MNNTEIIGVYNAKIYALKNYLKTTDDIVLAWVEGDCDADLYYSTIEKRKSVRAKIKEYENAIASLK